MTRDRDSLQRFLFEHTGVRGELVHLDASWQALVERHTYAPAVRELLGEALAAIVLLAATIKFKGSIILQIQGDGPVKLLVVQMSAQRTVRGMAEAADDIQPGSLKELFGNGHLAITIDPGEGAERYQGIVELGDGGLTEAIEGYFRRSEQLATRLWLAADEQQVGGLLVQRLPGPTEDADAWERVVQLSATITERELLGLPFLELIRRLFHEEDVRVFDTEPISFRCSCSRSRIEETLRGLGHEEVRDILDEFGKVSVDCSFCNQHYEFDAVDAEQIFAADYPPAVPKTRH